MKTFRTVIFMLLIPFVPGIQSCSVTLNVPHESLAEGFFHAGSTDAEKVYVSWQHDTLVVHAVNNDLVEAGQGEKSFPAYVAESTEQGIHLVRRSFDLDFMTILFKYRPTAPSLPRQLNTDLSGAIYLGYRFDHFRLAYKNPYPGIFSREINHIGYSGGIFTGLGATAMNPWVTSDAITKEYEGIVWSGGIAGLVGVSQFTLGLAIGWDFLLDANREFWIYQGKPWFGLTVGVNLN